MNRLFTHQKRIRLPLKSGCFEGHCYTASNPSIEGSPKGILRGLCSQYLNTRPWPFNTVRTLAFPSASHGSARRPLHRKSREDVPDELMTCRETIKNQTHQVIQFVTSLSPKGWRSQSTFGMSLNHPKKVTKTCQAHNRWFGNFNYR